jgi:predicted  nucleic acid-binding Zn-ribbon protein
MKIYKILTEGTVTPLHKKILNILYKKGVDDSDIVEIWAYLGNELYIDDYDMRLVLTHLYHNYPDGDVESYEEEEIIDPTLYEKPHLALAEYLDVHPDAIEEGKYKHYDLNQYDDTYNGGEYAVGTESEIDEAMEQYAKGLLEQIDVYGVDFIERYLKIDENYVRQVAREMAQSYVSDMSDDEIIERYRAPFDEIDDLISELNDQIDSLEETESNILDEIPDLQEELGDIELDSDEDYDRAEQLEDRIAELEDKVMEISDAVEELRNQIDELESKKDDLVEELKEEYEEELEDDYYDDIEGTGVSYFTKGWGMDIKDVIGSYYDIDEEEFISDFSRENWGGALSSYDGNYDEINIGGVDYYIIRTN